MPLGLNPRCLDRLREVIAAALPQLEVHYGAFLTSNAFTALLRADEVPPQGAVREKLQACVGEYPVSTFIYHRVNAELLAQQHPRDVERAQLVDYPEFSDPHGTAARLVAEFESLPWEYTITFAMPKAFSDVFIPEVGTYRLSPKTTLVSHDAGFEAEFAIPPPAKTGSFADLALLGEPIRHRPGNSYMQTTESGFMGTFGTTPLSHAVQSNVRAFAGLGLALHLFKWSRPQERSFARPAFVVHHRVLEQWVFECEDAWRTDQSRAFAELQLEDLDGRLATPQQKGNVMRGLLPVMATAFSHEKRARRIRLGAQWFFDSFCESDLPLAFVEAAVVLEVLLGDKTTSEEVGLTKLLANRCAYLVASSQSDRERIIRDFTDIYNVRSKIVHEGKSTLSFEEQGKLMALRNLCGRALLSEITLLEKEVSATPPTRPPLH